ncbi:uncharacterized protein JN550_002978 [Neoarthrinium moseri]|uniref:uncharacterized protein n=1 Tax=Neoarthrinium moseri TaxID=1658444 RepID=UPI001FDE313C|nr:uncharacterized protein JN550_002978 [Neoarthrinium moseri]KAI1873709.1 hypothetical protein JN550_002978 [Neoarthrinium moseri]
MDQPKYFEADLEAARQVRDTRRSDSTLSSVISLKQQEVEPRPTSKVRTALRVAVQPGVIFAVLAFLAGAVAATMFVVTVVKDDWFASK